MSWSNRAEPGHQRGEVGGMEYFVIMNRTVGGYVGSQMSDTDGYTSLASAERFSSKAAA